MPGSASSSSRPRSVAAGPEPGPADHRCSRTLRPNRAGRFTASKAVPQGSTLGAVGRADHRARTLRGKALAEASQSAPSGVGYCAYGDGWEADSGTPPAMCATADHS